MKMLIATLASWMVLAVSLPAAPLAAAEWFIDLDPGEGLGTGISGITGDSLTREVTVNPTTIDSLTDGPHLLGIRFQDDAGDWGQVTWRLFLVAHPGNKLSSGEYFFNTDPGEGAATALEGINGETIALLPEASLTTLPFGANLIGIRFQNSEGAWGQTTYRLFLNPEPADQALSRIDFRVLQDDTELSSGSLLGDGSLVIDLQQVRLDSPLEENSTLVLELQPVDDRDTPGHKFAREIPVKSFSADFLDLFFTPAEQADPAISGPMADADRDGISNLLEQAAGLDPRSADEAGKVAGLETGAGSSRSFRFQAADESTFDAPTSTFSLGGLRFEIETSDDAQNWNKATFPADFTIAPASVANEDGSFSHVLTLHGEQDRRFHRLKVIRE